jgi:Zn-dependent M28 family amino/carboxypeptidase
MPRLSLLGTAASLALLAACSQPADPASAEAASTAQAGTGHAFSTAITEADFGELVRTLASDAFEGRGPGSAGEERTVEYIRAQMQRIGLQPGNGDSWYQDVPMVETTADPATVLKLSVNGQPRELAFGTDMVLGTRSGQAQVRVQDSPMVFVGYGVDAPERDWNDYAGQDWSGKTVLILVNDPGFHTDDETLFDGRKMTYYGRWTYKFEEAARKGAAAAFIIHDTAGASYGWDVVRNSWSGAQYDLPAEDDPAPRLPVQGWLSEQAARDLFAGSGLDLDQAYRDANKPGFRPVPLKATASVELASAISRKTSRNVIGVLPGTTRPDEAVLHMAHWDHLGKHEGEGDTIYNGAVDNATGVAGILEIADQLANAQPRSDRSQVFLAVTLEESGLLGSQYYVAHPTFPLDKIIGVINLDALSVAGRSRNLVVTGLGNSQLEDELKVLADADGRSLESEQAVQSGFYFRSDHFNFAKAGVPALYAKGGDDLVQGGKAAGKAVAEEYGRKRYHQPADEYDPAWKLDGVVQDLNTFAALAANLGSVSRWDAPASWPNWYPGNPFRARRDQMLSGPAPQH